MYLRTPAARERSGLTGWLRSYSWATDTMAALQGTPARAASVPLDFRAGEPSCHVREWCQAQRDGVGQRGGGAMGRGRRWSWLTKPRSPPHTLQGAPSPAGAQRAFSNLQTRVGDAACGGDRARVRCGAVRIDGRQQQLSWAAAGSTASSAPVSARHTSGNNLIVVLVQRQAVAAPHSRAAAAEVDLGAGRLIQHAKCDISKTAFFRRMGVGAF